MYYTNTYHNSIMVYLTNNDYITSSSISLLDAIVWIGSFGLLVPPKTNNLVNTQNFDKPRNT